MLIRILLFGFCLMVAPKFNIEINASNDPGFSEAVFDAKTIQDLLDRRDCDGIRFYNTMGSDGKLQVMAVSVAAGADMNGGLFPMKPYVVAAGIMDNKITVEKISKSKAKDYCEAIDLSSHTQYSALFSKTELDALLKNTDCNALRIAPAIASGKLSMEVHAVNFRDGSVTDLGRGAGFDLLDTDPCPPVCGPSSNYVYSRE